jgi:arylsulfatase A-like enzyme
MIEQVDTEVGRMLNTPESHGQADNTIVIYMSDHGEILGHSRNLSRGGRISTNARCGCPDDPLARPLKSGLATDALVEMMDLVRTLLDGAGIPVHSGVQGRSLTRVLTGQSTKHSDSVYSEHLDSSSLYETPPMACVHPTERHKLTYFHNSSVGDLYNLEKDPGEVENLWAQPGSRDIRQEMTEKLVGRMVETIDPLPELKTTW